MASVSVVCSLIFLFVSHNCRFSSLVSNSALYFLFYRLYFVKHFSVFGSGQDWEAEGAIVCAVLSHFSRIWLLVTVRTAACQTPLFMGFSRQEYWSGLSCPPLGDLPGLGIEPESPMSPALADRFFTTRPTWAWWEPNKYLLNEEHFTISYQPTQKGYGHFAKFRTFHIIPSWWK